MSKLKKVQTCGRSCLTNSVCEWTQRRPSDVSQGLCAYVAGKLAKRKLNTTPITEKDLECFVASASDFAFEMSVLSVAGGIDEPG